MALKRGTSRVSWADQRLSKGLIRNPKRLAIGKYSSLWMDRRALQPGLQLCSMTAQDRDEFIVIDITETLADVGLSQESEVRHQLTEPHVR